jgi:uncharacterized protein YprB with RNaseH-like and TPR domain
MLTSTFCHILGIGEKTERGFWSAGFKTWEVALSLAGGKPPPGFRPRWVRQIEESLSNYQNRNLDYFAANLPTRQHWRFYPDFQDCCAFIDIETTGLFPPAEVTTAALYDGRTIRSYVNGQNLDHFARDIQDYRLLVTYNGKCFDVPFIERYFGIQLSQAHIDLRYPLRSLGFTGGQKGCETRLGVNRPGVEGIDGLDAIWLWDEYRRRNQPKALETLLAYNVQDAINLQPLMVHAYNGKVKGTPFAGSHSLPSLPSPKNPFQADRETVERLRGLNGLRERSSLLPTG